jgi:hypothetical protein
MDDAFRALNATCIAWMAARDVSPSAREILIQRLDVLVRSVEVETGRKVKRTAIKGLDAAGEVTQAAVLLVREWQAGGDAHAAERQLGRALFAYFLERSEEATRRSGLSAVMLEQLGIRTGNEAA